MHIFLEAAAFESMPAAMGPGPQKPLKRAKNAQLSGKEPNAQLPAGLASAAMHRAHASALASCGMQLTPLRDGRLLQGLAPKAQNLKRAPLQPSISMHDGAIEIEAREVKGLACDFLSPPGIAWLRLLSPRIR